MSTTSRVHWRALRAVAIVALVAAIPHRAGAESDNPRAERERVRRERAEAAAELDTLQASDDQVSQALAGLEQNLAEQNDEVTAAIAATQAATLAASDARAAQQAKEEQQSTTEQLLRDLALDAYVSGGEGSFAEVLSVDTDSADALAWSLSQLQASRLADAVDTYDQVRSDATAYRIKAEDAQVAAEAAQAAEQQRLAELEQAKADHEALAAKLEDRIDRALGEVAALESRDKVLSDQIAAEQAELARRLAASRPVVVSGSGSSSGSSGSDGGGGGGGTPGVVVGTVEVTSVRGIVVSVTIADQIANLLDAASGAGLNLSGYGFRDPSQQIAVRRSNCGSSDYDIYVKPASQCRPPTARPGKSMHERGLAIDFTCNGSIIGSRSNACYQWLAANAGRYGLKNLPSEPWHWSTNGN